MQASIVEDVKPVTSYAEALKTGMTKVKGVCRDQSVDMTKSIKIAEKIVQNHRAGVPEKIGIVPDAEYEAKVAHLADLIEFAKELQDLENRALSLASRGSERQFREAAEVLKASVGKHRPTVFIPINQACEHEWGWQLGRREFTRQSSHGLEAEAAEAKEDLSDD